MNNSRSINFGPVLTIAILVDADKLVRSASVRNAYNHQLSLREMDPCEFKLLRGSHQMVSYRDRPGTSKFEAGQVPFSNLYVPFCEISKGA